MSVANQKSCLTAVLAALLAVSSAHGASPAASPEAAKGDNRMLLQPVPPGQWDETHVRRVLRAFAFGGLATDSQIAAWGGMSPDSAIQEMLTFDVNNALLSPPEDANADKCGSLADLQDFWSSDDPENLMTWQDRSLYSTLDLNQDLSRLNLQLTWTKAITTRGCNPFLHKMAMFLTNYHAAIHVSKTRAALMRAYYDDYLTALAAGQSFIEIMTMAASHPTVARAYGHQDNRIQNGYFFGNEDFAREYLQLLFGVLGTTEDPDYYETVSIKNNALLLTGMNLDKIPNAYGADHPLDWFVSPIDFSDHTDQSGRPLLNATFHYENELGAASCLEILHADICGATADVKLQQLGPVAGNHPESMANVPVMIVSFFADDNLDQSKIDEVRNTWANANFDLLAFIREYATSTAFHSETTFKYLTSFDRNLAAQNATILNNEENFAKPVYWAPFLRMRFQGVYIFEPVRDVFGHQTGIDAANNPFIFKDAYKQNTINYFYHVLSSYDYTLENGGGPILWEKDWGAVIPVNGSGEHVVAEVADWLWNRLIADGGKNFDVIAKAQVQSFLATGKDFGFWVDYENRDPEVFYSSDDINGGNAAAAQVFSEHASALMDLSTKDANERVGMAVNFITMTPYAFAMEGK